MLTVISLWADAELIRFECVCECVYVCVYVLLTAMRCVSPAWMSLTLVSVLNSFRPNSVGGIRVGNSAESTLGPFPSIPYPQTYTSPASETQRQRCHRYYAPRHTRHQCRMLPWSPYPRHKRHRHVPSYDHHPREQLLSLYFLLPGLGAFIDFLSLYYEAQVQNQVRNQKEEL